LFGGENRAVGFGRYLDATVFGKKPDGRSTTYDDLIARWTPAAAPFVILNATDMSSGRNFEFTQAAFDDLCSDLGRFPLSQAVAASAAFPVLLNPVPLKNHWADRDCSAWVRGKRGQDQLRDAEDKKLSEPEQLGRARYVYSLRNAGNKDAKPEPDREIRFVHLLDGGLADNLGLRAVLRHLHDNYATLKDKGVRRILLVQVNARSATPSSYDLSADLPSAVDVFEAVAERPIDVTTEISSYLSRLYLLRLVTGSDAAVADRISIYPVDVDFELLDDRKTRLDAERIRTDWGLAQGKVTVDFLEGAAATLMKANPCYQSFIARPPGPGVEGPRETCGFVQLLAQKTGNEGTSAPRPPPASVPPPPAPLPPPVAVGINFAMIVNFEAGSATLEPAAKARLDDLVTKLQQIKLDALIVTGFADAKERDAKRLSKSRAEAVKMYFALKGVDMKRVEIEARIGDGRRVEIEVVGKK
jgi:outer membrane protein OmpA-like peptidoglycan-associated protein/predicted acylesterase/phospholipase RssA